MVLLRIPVPVDETNLDNGGALPKQPVYVADRTYWARIRVSGQVDLGHHPPCVDACTANGWTSCPPPVPPQAVSPAGVVVDGQIGPRLKVFVTIYGAGWGRQLTFNADGSLDNGVVYTLLRAGDEVSIQRTGIGGARSSTSGSIPFYSLASSQHLEIQEVPAPIRISLVRQYLPAVGDTAVAVAIEDATITQNLWYFIPGDTLATPQDPTYLPPRLYGCDGQKTCRHVPTTSGRFYATGAHAGQLARAASEPVWVGRAEPECPSGANGLSAACAPEPVELECLPAAPERGSRVSCRVSGEATVQRWRFSGPSGSTVDRQGASLPTEWAGDAVVGGMVTANVLVNGELRTLTATYSVTPRNWLWGPEKRIFRPGAARQLTSAEVSTIREPVIGEAITYGWNCNYPDCTGARVRPEITKNDPEAGFTLAAPESGPNEGLWYVASADYSWDRASNLSPFILPSAATRTISGSQAAECHANGMPGEGPVEVNFYTFNSVCKGIDMEAFINAAWAHEGRGTAGNNGHESVAEAFVSQPDNDPHSRIEALWHRHRARLLRDASRAAGEAQRRINERSGDHRYVKNNFSGRLWMWNPSTSRYELTTQPVRF